MHLFCNWKMYLSHAEAVHLASAIAGRGVADSLHMAVFPNTLSLTEVQAKLSESAIAVGAQTVAWTPQGAYTGATSAALFMQAGCTYALVGHSERRYVFGETNDDVRRRFDACQDAGLTPVLCIGETAEDREEGKRDYRLKKQLMKVLEGQKRDIPFFVAYEPVWAISQAGEGEACDPVQVEEVHNWIAEELKQYTDRAVPILYGGSVDAHNAVGYCSLPDVAGVLVGHAAAKQEMLFPMIDALEALRRT